MLYNIVEANYILITVSRSRRFNYSTIRKSYINKMLIVLHYKSEFSSLSHWVCFLFESILFSVFEI